MTAHSTVRATGTPDSANEFPWSCMIPAEPASKANSREMVWRIARDGRKYLASIKSEKARSFAEIAAAVLALQRPPQPFEMDLVMECRIFYASRRPDLDASIIMDALQAARVIKNDRQLREIHLWGDVDKGRPRALVMLYPVEMSRHQFGSLA